MRFAIYRKCYIKHNRQCLSRICRKRKVPREILYDGIKWRKPCWNLALGAGRHIFDPVGKSVVSSEDLFRTGYVSRKFVYVGKIAIPINNIRYIEHDK